jgi:predicted phosphoribosyltransferase
MRSSWVSLAGESRSPPRSPVAYRCHSTRLRYARSDTRGNRSTVTPGRGGVYVRSHEDLGESELRRAIDQALAKADALDQILHERHQPLDLHGKAALLVDDGLATGATMVAAVRWARNHGAMRVVVAVPVGAIQSVRLLRQEADEIVCPHAQASFGAVGYWYDVFTQVENEEVVALLDELRTRAPTL